MVTTKSNEELMLKKNAMCPEQDSNLHAENRHQPLKLACLPISPSGHFSLAVANVKIFGEHGHV
jgi:hypothetical protein